MQTVLVRKHVRQSKYDAVVERADLIHATPQYALARFKNGREGITVSLRDLAPVLSPEIPIPLLDKNVTLDSHSENDPSEQLPSSIRHESTEKQPTSSTFSRPEVMYQNNDYHLRTLQS